MGTNLFVRYTPKDKSMAPENYFCQVRRCDTPGERVKVQWFGDLVGFKNKLTLLDTKGLCLLIFKFILFYLFFFFFVP